MKLTSAQQAMFWRLWSAAKLQAGWDSAEAETQRKGLLRECGFCSLTEVDKTEGFTRLQGALKARLGILDGGTSLAFPAVCKMRRQIHVIERRLLPALGGVGVANAEAYADEVAADKFGASAGWRALAESAERGPGQIQQLLMTLTRALRTRAKVAKPLRNRASAPAGGQIASAPSVAAGVSP